MEVTKIALKDLRTMTSEGYFHEITPYNHINPIVRWLFWKRLQVMLKFSVHVNRVLDFGGGSGVFLPTLSKQFPEVWCADIETNSLEYVKKKYDLNNVKVVKSPSGCLPVEDRFFDIVFAGDVLEHFPDSEPIQKELFRVLKVGGCLIVSGPTENFLYKVSRKLIYWFWGVKHDHYSNIYDIMKISRRYFTIEKVKTLPFRFVPGFKLYRARKKSNQL